jgi:hypothetical protein
MAEVQKTSLSPELERIIADALQRGVADGIAMANMANQRPVSAPPTGYPGEGPTCPVCKLRVSACKGEHVAMAVYPENPRFGKQFQGLKINGVLFLSNSAQHRIQVPAKNNFLAQIQAWERNEDEMMNGRVAERDSGSIGRHGTGFQPATSAWR